MSTLPSPGVDKSVKIRALNDMLRITGLGGKTLIIRGISALPEQDRSEILQKVRAFDAFTEDNDPHREHDFGNFTHSGQKIFWKIDYYNPSMTGGSEDPADARETVRVLTIMLALEY